MLSESLFIKIFYTNEIILPPIIADSQITILIICPILYATSFEDV